MQIKATRAMASDAPLKNWLLSYTYSAKLFYLNLHQLFFESIHMIDRGLQSISSKHWPHLSYMYYAILWFLLFRFFLLWTYPLYCWKTRDDEKSSGKKKKLNYDDAKRIIHEVIKLTLEEKWSADSGEDKPADDKK